MTSIDNETKITMYNAASLSYEVVVNHCCLLGEGPVWDQANKSICWLDILKGNIHEFCPAENKYRTMQVNGMIGAVALCTNGDFLAALKTGLAFINRTSGEVKLLHHPEIHLPENRFNDGKCDLAGRFWIGTMSLAEEVGAGSLYMIEKDLSQSVKIKDVTISNGMAWSPNHKTFFTLIHLHSKLWHMITTLKPEKLPIEKLRSTFRRKKALLME